MMRFSPWMMLLGAVMVLCSGAFLLHAERPAGVGGSRSQGSGTGRDAGSTGDQVCAACHRAIYDRYETTAMARASGLAVDGLITGSFRHAASGVEYKVFLRDGEGWMSYRRAAGGGGPDPGRSLNGEFRLRYFIGSGHRGRTYLYEESKLWFETPINYYSKKELWDMAPNFGGSRRMPDGLPVDPNCLHCHASDLQTALPTARNRYADVPFRQGGIRCEACHGDPSAHLAERGKGAILNPATFVPVKRDSVCLQCHLEGDAAVYRAGKSLVDYRPGEDLADFVSYFVRVGAEGGGGRAASQYEALLRSRCKIASGDKLTCTTCHDPHGSPSEAERVNYYRAKCLSCHGERRIASQHHPEQQDCAACHMRRRTTVDISHEQTTDHDIQRRPSQDHPRPEGRMDGNYRLVPVGSVTPGDREFGLAYAQAAALGNHDALQQSLQYLRRAEIAGHDDAKVESELGFLEQMSGNAGLASSHYQRALKEDADDNSALANEAVLEAVAGRIAEALPLLSRVLDNDPSEVTAGLDLAYIDCVVGRKAEAKKVLLGLLRFSPDDGAVQSFLQQGSYAGRHCNLEPAGESATRH